MAEAVPQSNTDEKDPNAFSIQKVPVVGKVRYKAGHVCSEAEADYLCKAERNIVASALNADVKEMVEEADDITPDLIAKVQAMVDEIWDSIKLGERRPGSGRTANPVRTKALNLLRDRVRQALADAGHDLNEISAKQISDLARKALAQNEDLYMQQAREILELENAKFAPLELEISD
jgi:hypothetical protein